MSARTRARLVPYVRPWMLALVLLAPAASPRDAAADDPLPSWNDRAAKAAILDFVERVTTPGGDDFVPEAERIATFDNDGTLWAEQPFYSQLAFALANARTRFLTEDAE